MTQPEPFEPTAATCDLRPELSDDARDAMSLPPRDRGRRIGVQIGRWFIGASRGPETPR